jgi:glycosyltransferase involved in cell wall biosynthesis
MTTASLRIAISTTEHISEKPDGGLANYTDRIRQALRKNGHYVDVYTTSTYREEQDNTPEGKTIHVNLHDNPASNLARIIFNRVNFPSSPDINIILRGLALRSSITKRHKIIPYDIVHYPNLEGLGAFRIKAPTIVRLSSYYELWENHGQPKDSRLRHFLEDTALRRADSIFAPSAWVAHHVQNKFGRQCAVVESPIAIQTKHHLEPDSTVINQPFGFFFGSLSAHKGIFQLLEAIDLFFTENDDHNFLIAGPTWYPDRNITDKIQTLQHKHQNRLVVLPTQHKEYIYNLIRRCSFVALPSLAENFSNAALEAMALGAIVIGTNGRSFEQLIIDGKSGFLCEPANSMSLLRSIRRAASLSEPERRAIAIEARKRTDKNSPEEIVHQLLKLYNNTIAKPSRRF